MSSESATVGSKSTTTQLALGHVGPNSHGLHPFFVHFPVAFLGTAYSLDVASSFLRGPTLATVAKLGYQLNWMGILFAVPASLTGFAEYTNVVDTHPAKKLGQYHAGLNTAVGIESSSIFLNQLSWCLRVQLVVETLYPGLPSYPGKHNSQWGGTSAS